VIGSLLALAGRCLYLQHFRGDFYRQASLNQQRAYAQRQPQRGAILDCRGRVLAASNRVQVIFADPRDIEDAKTTSSELAPFVDMGAHVICQLILESRNPRFARIKTSSDANECAAAIKIPGIGVQSNWRRHYPSGRVTANLVGFTSRDNRGLEGIELAYDEELSGSPAQNIFLADVRRRPIALKEHEGVLTNGVGIVLTIDSTIQQFVRDELIKQYASYEAESAVAVVAEPKTGAILAMVSLPDFDPAEAGRTDPNNFRSRAITDWYEPGSIIKPFAVAVALDAGAINKTDTIFCENGSYSGKGFGRIGEYRRGFGTLTIAEILIESSNIGMAKIGQRTGKDKLYAGLRLFGFGQPTGIELPGEVAGLLRPPGQWTGYSVTRIPFGQEICVTGMQLVRAFCILANGGRLVRPFMVRAVVQADGKITELNQPTPPVGYIIKPQVAEWLVKDTLVRVITEGTGKRAQLDKWKVFGKSGTANIALSDTKGYSENDYVASFIAGAPVEDPAIVVLVSIRKPNKALGKGYNGGVVAAPVAARIIERTLNYLGVR
jgi:cell division protein FtsI (penicillin-binding protein 3)